MDVQQQGILTLVKSAVTGEKLTLPAEFDLDAALPPIKAHKIAPLVYEGVVHCGVSQQNAVQLLFQSSCRAFQVNERQMRAIDRICAAFEEAGVAYMPLKGSILKALYPQPALRLMGDADILIRSEQYTQITAIMERLGFRRSKALDYEYTWRNDALHVELHRRLFSPQKKDLFAYYGDGWGKAKLQKGMRYAMTPEDTMIYLIAHFAKHYRGSGIGCRHMVDLWMYLRSHPDLDQAYIEAELEKLRLLVFWQHVRRTIAWWFEGGSPDDITEMISGMVFASGSWGNSTSAAIADGMRNQKEKPGTARGRVSYVLHRVFPGKEKLHLQYPVLDQAPWLLPAVWIYYIIGKVFLHKTTWQQHASNLQSLTADNMESRQQMLRAVGLE